MYTVRDTPPPQKQEKKPGTLQFRKAKRAKVSKLKPLRHLVDEKDQREEYFKQICLKY